jgi:hypothetical protein
MNTLAVDMLRVVSLLTAVRPWCVTRAELVPGGSLFGGRPGQVRRYVLKRG